MNKFISGWYLIYTRPKHERKVYAQLKEAAIDSFLPVKRELRVLHDRKKFVDVPLFPSYIFVYLNDLKNYYDGINVQGSLYYVSVGKKLARIDERIVDSLRNLIAHFKNAEEGASNIQQGKQMVIRQGPLVGLTCEIVKINNKNKIVVRVGILKRNILLTVSEECFASAGEGK